jgi:hypothetical protein
VHHAVRQALDGVSGILFGDHDLRAVDHDKGNALCTVDLLITTTINGSIAHNLSA